MRWFIDSSKKTEILISIQYCLHNTRKLTGGGAGARLHVRGDGVERGGVENGPRIQLGMFPFLFRFAFGRRLPVQGATCGVA